MHRVWSRLEDICEGVAGSSERAGQRPDGLAFGQGGKEADPEKGSQVAW